MNCIIVEDQRPAQEILEKYISDIGLLKLVGVFTDAIQAMDAIKTGGVDLIFLDIHLPKLSGTDFIKTLQNPPKVILTTAFPNYALESYELNVVDYLLKPFSFKRFVQAVSKVTIHLSSVEKPTTLGEELNKYIFIKSGYDHIRIAIDEILYLKSDSDYTEIHLTGQKQLSSEPLKYWEETLIDHRFIRIHKSYIVNSTKVQKVSSTFAYLSKDISLPIGRVYKDDFARKLL